MPAWTEETISKQLDKCHKTSYINTRQNTWFRLNGEKVFISEGLYFFLQKGFKYVLGFWKPF